MAIVEGLFKPTGTLEGVTFYKRHDSDKLIMRKKGGPKKDRVKKGKEYEKLRQHQAEWGGCVQFARKLTIAVGDLYVLSDFNLWSVWSGMGKKLITLDTENEIGTRCLLLSTYKQALVDFNFCRKKPLISILRLVPTFEIERESMRAVVRYNRIITAADLVNGGRYPYFRIVAALGCISDMKFEKTLFSNYVALNDELHGLSMSVASEWLSTNDVLENKELEIQYEEKWVQLLSPDVSLVLTIGVEFGAVGFGTKIEAVKRSGAAKIVAVV